MRAMSAFHLEARLFVGPLSAPERDEWRHAGADSWAEAERWVEQQVAAGFTVWVYDHGRPSPIPSASDLRLVAHARPGHPAGITFRHRPDVR
ncbi:hypothetical protein BJF78_21695 [Pseudonocardia sp. CNS-139]|nr:hypothetical protein BJF78_21695 [Pseudonocardia sp. CNS-139]